MENGTRTAGYERNVIPSEARGRSEIVTPDPYPQASVVASSDLPRFARDVLHVYLCAMAGEYIFTMRDLLKIVPPQRKVSSRGSISLYPGAKIGVIGVERQRQVVAAQDHGRRRKGVLRRGEADGRGEARPISPRSPSSTPPRMSAATSEGGAPADRATCWSSFEEISAKFSEPMTDDEMTALLDKQASLQDRIEAANAWEIDRTVDIAMDALRCPPGDAEVKNLSGGEKRRVALTPSLLSKPGHAAARRADQPPRCRIGRVAGAVPQGVHRYRRRDHARPLLPRQRRRNGFSNSSNGAGIPWKSRLPRRGSSQKRGGLEARERRQASARQVVLLERELECGAG